jgi:MSHA biogenesis protein MshI
MHNAFIARLHGWLKPGRKGTTIGIELQNDGMALVVQEAYTSKEPDAGIATKARLVAMDYLRYEKNVPPGQLLKNWVADHRLTNAVCHIVLGADTYQILLVEPPEVPDEELRGAIRWRLKDLLSIPVEQAALEVFALPADGSRGNKKMVYVVACESKKIKTIIDMAAEAGLVLDSIDINELALRNLALRLLPPEQAERGIAVARIRSGVGSVYIYRTGNLYLGRSFSLNYNGGLLDALPEESLALELQRSLDYYERQMGQAPPAVIYVCGEHVSEDKIGDVLKASLAPRVQWLNPAMAVQVAQEDPDDQVTQQCVAAIGAALRQPRIA